MSSVSKFRAVRIAIVMAGPRWPCRWLRCGTERDRCIRPRARRRAGFRQKFPRLDSVEARFTHPDVDPKQPLYWLQTFRAYPDVVHATPPRVRISFDEVRNELFRRYGKPSDERRERIVSYAASTETSLGVVKKVKREDYLVRYLCCERPARPLFRGRGMRLRGPLCRGLHRDFAVARDDTAEQALCTERAAARRGPRGAPPAGRVECAAAKRSEALKDFGAMHANVRQTIAATLWRPLLTLPGHFLY